MKRILKEMKWDALSTGVLYIVLGVMALALPETMEKILGYMIGVVLITGGAVSMISYLIRDARQNYYHNDFLHGLIGIAAGILVLVKMEVVIGLISFLLGVLVLVSGCSKLQDVIDMKRLECGNWIVMLVIAVVNVGFGILLICNPFSWTILLFRLLGIGLIFSGVIDCVSTFYFAGRIRKYLDSLTAVDSTFVEVTGGDGVKRQETAGEQQETAEKQQEQTTL
ncbi:MAG: DUF308 domain-containing protein [Butyrivibrio sp.]|nr:DUF308 domain-containing protein [Acetatifactor muris]MCM1558406.1 DUF308 domain-containing protein [Butyrivibrio sp.]